MDKSFAPPCTADKPYISVVVPCFNEEEVLPIFYDETLKVLKSINCENYEFVFVDDGSSDSTIKIFRDISEKNKKVHFISFSRNFGKEAAIYAGLSKANGIFTAVMDADMQDPPSLLPQMLKALTEEGFDCAATRRSTRKNEPVLRSFFARKFYKIMQSMSDVKVVDGARDFRLMSETYRKAVISLCERNRFTKGIFPWVGFNTKYFEYENVERAAGKTKWSFWKLFKYSIDGIIGFSTKPLALASFLGVFMLLVAFAFLIFIIVRKILNGDPVQGWASMACIIIFASGLQLFTTGILGLYLSKIYIEVKQRPIYIVKEEK
ncbi:glycosyltransferase family 2 protein [Treponema sp.]|uniref:glycosyltransferase family 2 protein n=1 Tax=Treponema sp. TaxID=166 RepID=UPI00388EEF51